MVMLSKNNMARRSKRGGRRGAKVRY